MLCPSLVKTAAFTEVMSVLLSLSLKHLKLGLKLSWLLKLYCSVLFNLFLNYLQGLMGSCVGEFRTGLYRVTAQLEDAVRISHHREILTVRNSRR